MVQLKDVVTEATVCIYLCRGIHRLDIEAVGREGDEKKHENNHIVYS